MTPVVRCGTKRPRNHRPERVVRATPIGRTSALAPTGDPDNQQSDESVEDSAFDRDREVLRVEEELVDEVRDALERVAAGPYGICENCERPIEKERLALVPQAATCAECARREEES